MDVWMLLVKHVPIVDRRGVPVKPVAIVTNSLSRTTANAILDASNLIWRGRLLENVRDTCPLVPSDVVRGALSAEVTVCALVGDVILAGYVQRVSVREFRHARSIAERVG
jgi:hypothetical protein